MRPRGRSVRHRAAPREEKDDGRSHQRPGGAELPHGIIPSPTSLPVGHPAPVGPGSIATRRDQRRALGGRRRLDGSRRHRVGSLREETRPVRPPGSLWRRAAEREGRRRDRRRRPVRRARPAAPRPSKPQRVARHRPAGGHGLHEERAAAPSVTAGPARRPAQVDRGCPVRNPSRLTRPARTGSATRRSTAARSGPSPAMSRRASSGITSGRGEVPRAGRQSLAFEQEADEEQSAHRAIRGGPAGVAIRCRCAGYRRNGALRRSRRKRAIVRDGTTTRSRARSTRASAARVARV